MSGEYPHGCAVSRADCLSAKRDAVKRARDSWRQRNGTANEILCRYYRDNAWSLMRIARRWKEYASIAGDEPLTPNAQVQAQP